MSRRLTVLIIKIFIIAVILALLYWQFDFSRIFYVIYHIQQLNLFLAFLVLVIQINLAAFRWYILLRIMKIQLSIHSTIYSFSSGSFLNSITLGGVGGDVVRVWYLIRNGVSSEIAICNIIIDRMLSMIGLSFLVIFAVGYNATTNNDLSIVDQIGVIVSIGAIISMAALFTAVPFIKQISRHLPALLIFTKFVKALQIVREHQQILKLIVMIMLVHLLLILAILILAHGINVRLSVTDAFLVMPSAVLLSSMPLLPGGWGIREGAIVLVLNRFGITGEDALAISMLFAIVSLASNIPGAILWITRDRHIRQLSAANWDKE